MYSLMNRLRSVSSRLSSMMRKLAFRSSSLRLPLLSSSTSICDLMIEISLLRCQRHPCSRSTCSTAAFLYSSTLRSHYILFLASSDSCRRASLRSASLSSSSASRSVTLLRSSEFSLRRPINSLYIQYGTIRERGSEVVHVLADQLPHLAQVVSDAGVLGRQLGERFRGGVLEAGHLLDGEAVVHCLQLALHALVVEERLPVYLVDSLGQVAAQLLQDLLAAATPLLCLLALLLGPVKNAAILAGGLGVQHGLDLELRLRDALLVGGLVYDLPHEVCLEHRRLWFRLFLPRLQLLGALVGLVPPLTLHILVPHGLEPDNGPLHSGVGPEAEGVAAFPEAHLLVLQALAPLVQGIIRAKLFAILAGPYRPSHKIIGLVLLKVVELPPHQQNGQINQQNNYNNKPKQIPP